MISIERKKEEVNLSTPNSDNNGYVIKVIATKG